MSKDEKEPKEPEVRIVREWSDEKAEHQFVLQKWEFNSTLHYLARGSIASIYKEKSACCSWEVTSITQDRNKAQRWADHYGIEMPGEPEAEEGQTIGFKPDLMHRFLMRKGFKMSGATRYDYESSIEVLFQTDGYVVYKWDLTSVAFGDNQGAIDHVLYLLGIEKEDEDGQVKEQPKQDLTSRLDRIEGMLKQLLEK